MLYWDWCITDKLETSGDAHFREARDGIVGLLTLASTCTMRRQRHSSVALGLYFGVVVRLCYLSATTSITVHFCTPVLRKLPASDAALWTRTLEWRGLSSWCHDMVAGVQRLCVKLGNNHSVECKGVVTRFFSTVLVSQGMFLLLQACLLQSDTGSFFPC